MNVLFDVDQTLIRTPVERNGRLLVPAGEPEPVPEMVALVRALFMAGHRLYVASGGGRGYAKAWCERMGIADMVTVISKSRPLSVEIDIAFDDQEVTFGSVNLKVDVGLKIKEVTA